MEALVGEKQSEPYAFMSFLLLVCVRVSPTCFFSLFILLTVSYIIYTSSVYCFHSVIIHAALDDIIVKLD